jgi:hypothetical protein
MSHLLRFLENEVQVACLIFMGSAYALRVAWLLRFKAPRERTIPRGSARAGILASLSSIARPGSMESTRQKPWFYVQFVVLHLGVAAAISATFIIPYRPAVLRLRPVALGFQAVLAAAFAVGLARLYRRLHLPAVRRVSSPDDYFSLALVTVYFASGFLAVPNRDAEREWPLILFFGLTAFFLVYVPFSKISHYLYYPFARYALGRTLGHRGVIPPAKGGGGVELEES